MGNKISKLDGMQERYALINLSFVAEQYYQQYTKPRQIKADGHRKLQYPVSYICYPCEDELTAVKAETFLKLNFNVYTGVDNRETARAEVKTNKQTNKYKKNMKALFSGYEKTKNVIDMLAATQVKMSGSEKEKKSEKEHIRHLFPKTCNLGPVHRQVSGYFEIHAKHFICGSRLPSTPIR